MPDMLVKLYELPDSSQLIQELASQGIEIRRPIAPEKNVVIRWVEEKFGQGWAAECAMSFSSQPVTCFIAVLNQTLIGFACFDATCKDFFGPTGVADEARGKGVGKALLLACLHQMRSDGYAYAIIGGAGPVEFYEKAVNAIAIEGSIPGIYKGMLT